MRSIGWLPAILLVSACAGLSAGSPVEDTRLLLWRDAHEALTAEQFGRADTLFTRITRDYPGSDTGKESLFLLGTIRLDPRNPGWNSVRAEEALTQYLALDSAAVEQTYRRPEAATLWQIAHQLNLPAEDRVPGLQGETQVVVREVTRVAPAARVSTLTAEVARLREQVAARDAQIRRQEEELERIRRTLAGTGARP